MSRDELIDVLANLVFVACRVKRENFFNPQDKRQVDDLMGSTATSVCCLINLYVADYVDFYPYDAFDMILHESWNNSSLDDLKQSFRKILGE